LPRPITTRSRYEKAPHLRGFRGIHLAGALSKSGMPGKLERLATLKAALARKAPCGAPQSPPPPPRIGAIARTILAVLSEVATPMHVADIHRAVERQLGRPVNPRSVKSHLSHETFKAKPRLQRTAYGYYALI
jgi:hypothetical protein